MKSHRKFWPESWTVVAGVIALLVILPIMAVFWLALFPSENIWPHLLSTTLPRYVGNSLGLMLGVASLSAVVGVTTAWVITSFDFPMRRQLAWLLMLPLAVPAYVSAYAFVDFFEYAGPVQIGLRSLVGWSSQADYWFPRVRSLPFAILVLALSLYPYIYLLMLVAFKDRSASSSEVARALGRGPTSTFLLVAFPLARPALIAGLAIVMMESLSDFGTVEHFAVQTLTTGIFTTWLEGSNVGGAAQISCIILIFMAFLVCVEKYSRRNARFYQLRGSSRPVARTVLRPAQAFLALTACLLPVFCGFALPVALLIDHTFTDLSVWVDDALFNALLASLMTGLIAAVATLTGALLLNFAVRLAESRLPDHFAPIASVGYAAPGAVLAIGILWFLTSIDHALADMLEASFGIQSGLLLTGTAFAVIFAYFVRFFAIARNGIDAGFSAQNPGFAYVARTLGRTSGESLREITLPLLRPALISSGLLVFVDCIKELPATLLLRPFGFNTLATLTYDKASLEDLSGAAAPALAIVMAGLVVVYLLSSRAD